MKNFSLILLSLGILFLAHACKSTSETSKEDVPAASLTDQAGWSWDGKSAYVLKFDGEGKLSLKLDVNNCFGEYSTEGSNMNIGGGFGCTEACCDEPEANTLVNAFYQVKAYSIKGNSLTLSGPEPALTFQLANQEND